MGPPRPLQGYQRMETHLSLWEPTPGSPLPQALASRPGTAYITPGPSVAAGGQAFLLNFQELLGSVG